MKSCKACDLINRYGVENHPVAGTAALTVMPQGTAYYFCCAWDIAMNMMKMERI